MQVKIDNEITNKLLECERYMHHHSGRYRSQETVLRILENNGPTSQKTLQDELKIKSGSISELLSKLEKQGFIAKQKDEKDGRAYMLSITQMGKKKLTDIKRKGYDEYYDLLTLEEKETLLELLNKIKLT